MAYVELMPVARFSFLRGGSFPEHVAEVAAQLQMPAMALLDRNGVYGAQRFSAAAREHGVRPIIGCELEMEDGTVLPVLVESRDGYRKLCELLTQAHLRSEKGKLRRHGGAELADFTGGLVALGSTGCHPVVCESLSQTSTQGLRSRRPNGRKTSGRHGMTSRAPRSPAEYAQRLIATFGHANVYIELQRHFVRGEQRRNEALIDLARAFNLPLLATNGVQYATPRGREVLDVFTCIREHTHLDAAGTLLTENAERHLKSDAEMKALFCDLPEAITNTERLADRLTFSLENIGYSFPDFPVPGGHDMNSFLRTITWFGAQQRYEAISLKVRRQLEEELALITRLGFAGYFLIVWDIVNFCREHNVMVQGRGSAANSAVCFCPRDHAG
jgi:error-prone DNA polymerase